MESIKEIDLLFAYLYNKKYQYTKYREIVKEHFNDDETRVDIEGMLIKLTKDGYVDVGQDTDEGKLKFGWSQQTIYKISFEGRLLFENSLENKPYFDLNKKEILEAEQIKSDLFLRKRNDRLLVIGTIGVAVGAIALVIWEVYKTFCLEKYP